MMWRPVVCESVTPPDSVHFFFFSRARDASINNSANRFRLRFDIYISIDCDFRRNYAAG